MKLPEDLEVKAGWGWINLNWLFGWAKEAIEWHDKVTSEGSKAQELGIPNKRVAEAFEDQLETMAKTGAEKQLTRFTGTLMRWIQHWFYQPKPPVREYPDPYQDDEIKQR